MIVEVPISNVAKVNFDISKKTVPQSDNKNLPFMFNTQLYIGSKGRGKSYSLVSLLTLYENSTISDGNAIYKMRCFLIAPTAYSTANSIYQSLKSLDKNDIYLEYTDDILQGIIDDIKNKTDEYDEYLNYKKIYVNFINGKSNKLTDEDLLLLDKYDFKDPNEIFGDNIYPYVNFIIFDDLVGTGSFSSKSKSLINNLTIKHRHLKTNLIFTTQGFKQIPPIIRNNIDIYVIFKSASHKEVLDKIYTDISGYLSYENFKELYEYATQDNHDSLVLINNSMDKSGIQLRKNWDKKLIIKN